MISLFCFFFQAEDGIRDLTVTGVQTCALPILKTKILSVAVLAATFLIASTPAQTPASAPSAPAPNQTIYVPRLPSAAELTNAAAAQGLSVEKIEQTSAQVTAFYKSSAGQTSIV